MTLGTVQKDEGWLPKRPTTWLENWNIQSHSPDLWGREEIEIESTIHQWWFNQTCLCNEASIETQKDRVWRAYGLVSMWRFGQNGALREGMKTLLFYCPLTRQEVPVIFFNKATKPTLWAPLEENLFSIHTL